MKIWLVILFIIGWACPASAQVEFDTTRNRDVKQIKVTGFIDYPPFGIVQDPAFNNSYFNPFQKIIAKYTKFANFIADYTTHYQYPQLVRMVRGGKIDIICGVYHDTEMYKGLDIVYPALVNNPIVLVMLPNRINEVKSKDNLKALKGAISANEHLSDFVQKEIDALNVEVIDDEYTLYKKLFNKEIDYILTSEYYNKVMLAKMGIAKQVAISKEPLWNMPLFLAVSKMSPYRKQIFNGLSVMLSQPEARESVNKAIAEYVNKIEIQNAGVVAPDFINK